MRLFFIALSLFMLISCAPRTRPGSSTQAGLCPEVGTVETRKPALISMFIKVKTCSGQPIPDLTIENFTILEDDEAISVTESRPDIYPREQSFRPITVLLLDLSGSVVKVGALADLKEAAKSFVGTLFAQDASASLAIYWFDGSADIFQLAEFSSSPDDLLTSLERLDEDTPIDDSTNLNGAIISGLSILDKEEKRLKNEDISFTLSSLVIFTDGTDRASRISESIATQAVTSASTNVLVQTVGLGSEIDEDKLRQVGRNGFEYARNLEQISAAFERAAARITLESKSYYLVRYCSPRRAGQHQITVQIRAQGEAGGFRQSFSADGFEAGCNPADNSGLLLAQSVPAITAQSVGQQATAPEAGEALTTPVGETYDVVCVRNETPWDIFYTHKWGEDAVWYETSVKPEASNVHPWPLSAANPSPKFFVRFDQDFSSNLDYKEYSLGKNLSNEQSCKNARIYVFKPIQGQQRVDLYVKN